MAYVITDDCVECGSCAAVCPADAISEGDGKYVIDADACLECGTCEAECPNEAIHAEYFKQSSRPGTCYYRLPGLFCHAGSVWLLLMMCTKKPGSPGS